MSITPNPTREIGNSCCSKCGRLLLVNDQAIVYEGMFNGDPLILATCCADLVLGSLVQDFADVLKKQTFSGHWLTKQHRSRFSRIADALESLSKIYRLSETCPFSTIESVEESGDTHAI